MPSAFAILGQSDGFSLPGEILAPVNWIAKQTRDQSTMPSKRESIPLTARQRLNEPTKGFICPQSSGDSLTHQFEVLAAVKEILFFRLCF